MSTHRWTPDLDARLLRFRADGVSVRKAAAILGLSEGMVGGRLQRLLTPASAAIPIDVSAFDAADTDWPPDPKVEIDRLIKITRRGTSLEAVCDELDLSPARVRELVEKARVAGYVVDIEGPHVGHRPQSTATEAVPVLIQAAGEHRIFAQMTDMHFGSKYHLGPQLRDFVALAYARGVRTMLITGDALEGCYPHARWELSHHGFQDQATFYAQTLPQLPGLTYHGITGNHDETFEKAAGLEMCRAIVDTFHGCGRNDLTMYGQRGGRLALKVHAQERGLVVDLWHPLKGPAYALSYSLQKKIEKYSPGQKPDMLFKGHHHDAGYFVSRGIHAFAGGCFQGGGGPYGNAIGGSPCIGGWIVEYAQTSDGTVRRVKPEWISYYESETVRDVSVGAAA